MRPSRRYTAYAVKQMDRRLLILMRLRAEHPVRAADLAHECESVRTIYRDIDALCAAGVPVAASRRGGTASLRLRLR